MTERNPILQSLFDRKSVRVYEEKPIPAEMKQSILEAAAQAPSAGCQQLYTILDITDPALKEALAESCDHQPFIAKAPLVLVFCADCKKWYDAYLEAGCTPRTPGVGDLMLAVTDAAIAAPPAGGAGRPVRRLRPAAKRQGEGPMARHPSPTRRPRVSRPGRVRHHKP